MAEQLEINIGKRCNNACAFCANGDVSAEDRRWVPIQLIKAEIDHAADQGQRNLGFLGGEPTAHPDIAEAVAHARQLGFARISLCTNGRRLRDPALLASLVTAGVNRITLSMHSHLAKVAEELNHRPGSFDEQVRAIRNVVQATQEGTLDLSEGFAVNSCIHGRNVRHLTAQARFLKELGVADVRFNFMRPENQAAGNATLVPRIGAVRSAIEKVILWNETKGRIRMSFSDLPLCAFPQACFMNPQLFRRYVGDVHDLDTVVTAFCGQDRERDYFNWKDRRRDELKDKPPLCAKCRVQPLCEGIWTAYQEIHGNSGLTAIP